MPSHKIDRATEDVKRELTDILRGLKDPRGKGLLSVVRVELTRDLSFAKVYVSAMEGLDAAKAACKGLDSASGFIRHEIAARVQLRHAPKFIFQPTDSIEYSAEIAKKLENLKGEEVNEEDSTQ